MPTLDIPTDPFYPLERKQTGRNGPFWPFPRHLMNSANAVVERMAEDITDLSRDGEVPVSGRDLEDLGWTLRQGQIYSSLALEKITARQHAAALGEVIP